MVSLASAACGGGEHVEDTYWDVRQAESITTIRSMRVHVLECHGVGPMRIVSGAHRYRRFSCLAGTRAPRDTYDTIGVFYVLHPLERYSGPDSRHSLTRVRFVGGPGIP
jgi:hypothetical protein